MPARTGTGRSGVGSRATWPVPAKTTVPPAHAPRAARNRRRVCTWREVRRECGDGDNTTTSGS